MLIEILVVLVIIGFVVWVADSAPFISPTVKPFIHWGAIAVGGFYVLKLVLDMLHVTPRLP